MSLAGLASNNLRTGPISSLLLSCRVLSTHTLQCSHRFLTELCTFMPRICCCVDVIVVAARARENGDRTDDGVAANRARGDSARAESVSVRKRDAIAALCV